MVSVSSFGLISLTHFPQSTSQGSYIFVVLQQCIAWQTREEGVQQNVIGPIPVWREIGMGFFLTRGEASSKEKKIPHESQMAHFKLPMNGLAGLMK